MPKPLPPEFRRDVIAVARKGEVSVLSFSRQAFCKWCATR